MVLKDLVIVVVGVILLAAVWAGWAAFQSWKQNTGIAPIGNEPVFCTQDAKLCPDGSYVGRTGPSCEFAPCPDGPDDFQSQ